MERELIKWLKITAAIALLIAGTIGFAIGYLIGDDSCKQNPLQYGIKKLNEANDDKFFCSCASGKFPQPITIDANGIKRTTSAQNSLTNPLAYPDFEGMQK